MICGMLLSYEGVKKRPRVDGRRAKVIFDIGKGYRQSAGFPLLSWMSLSSCN